MLHSTQIGILCIVISQNFPLKSHTKKLKNICMFAKGFSNQNMDMKILWNTEHTNCDYI